MRCAHLLPALAAGAAGHGYMLDPPPRAVNKYIQGAPTGVAGSCAGGICFWFNQGCTIGCPKCTGEQDGTCGKQQGKATLPQNMRTWWLDKPCGTSPWCAPGSAPVLSPCGQAGGGPVRSDPAGGIPPPGTAQGDDARALPELAAKTAWAAGSVVETQWAVIANHGGGYQYRLCPKGAEQTEECFQKTPVEFHGDEQYIQYCDPLPATAPYCALDGNATCPVYKACAGKRTTIPANKLSTGTIPKGSTWMKNPIPACNNGGYNVVCGSGHWRQGDEGGTSPKDYFFPPAGADESRPGQYLGGYGAAGCFLQGGKRCADVTTHMFTFNIVDKLVVPKVPPGEYVLSFRWDCEMSAQIWATCSDVTITA